MGYIFEAEIESIINSVRDRTIGEADNIRTAELLDAPIHPALKAYFRAEVEKLLQDERKNESRSKKLPYGVPEVAGLQRQMDLLLLRHYQFNRQEFNAVLDQAVHFQFNYLCRPQWTLMSFLFENKRRIPASDIERKLRYCVDYSYYLEIIKRYLSDRGLAEISYEEFQTLLEKIDREVVGRHSSIELARMTRALTAFVDAGLPRSRSGESEAALPINAAIVFFEDKKLFDIQKRLEEDRDKRQVESVTVHQLADIIEKVRTGDENALAASLENKADASVAEVEPATPAPKAREPERKESTRNELERTFLSIDSDPIGDVVPVPPNASAASTTMRHPIQKVELHELFSAAERKHFVKKLFRKDEVSFRDALDRLSTLETWQEATHCLDELFLANDVDAFSKEAIRLTEKVYSWYHPGESVEDS
jgi:hypothetical protein